MKLRNSLLCLSLAATALVAAAPVANASVMFQGVTFTFDQTSDTTLTFEIQNATSATDDWSGVQFLSAFDLKDLGEDFTTATATLNGPGATNVLGTNSQLSASNLDCSNTTGQTDTVCFNLSPDVALTSDMLYTITFSAPLSIGTIGPHLQIAFSDTQGGAKVGSLFSENVATTSGGPGASSGGPGTTTGGPGTTTGGAVPEPGTIALLGLGLVIIALGRRASKRA